MRRLFLLLLAVTMIGCVAKDRTELIRQFCLDPNNNCVEAVTEGKTLRAKGYEDVMTTEQYDAQVNSLLEKYKSKHPWSAYEIDLSQLVPGEIEVDTEEHPEPEKERTVEITSRPEPEPISQPISDPVPDPISQPVPDPKPDPKPDPPSCQKDRHDHGKGDHTAGRGRGHDRGRGHGKGRGRK